MNSYLLASYPPKSMHQNKHQNSSGGFTNCSEVFRFGCNSKKIEYSTLKSYHVKLCNLFTVFVTLCDSVTFLLLGVSRVLVSLSFPPFQTVK